ncbi:MAG: hypothetical protein H6722_17765 [Sandaracinus sp.]|nr:hypothetical protein [Sandaracinus sp.]
MRGRRVGAARPHHSHSHSQRAASGSELAKPIAKAKAHAAKTASSQTPASEKRSLRARRRPTFSPNAEQVLAHLSSSPTQRDALVACTGLSVPALQNALLELILADEARELPDGRVALAGVR